MNQSVEKTNRNLRSFHRFYGALTRHNHYPYERCCRLRHLTGMLAVGVSLAGCSFEEGVSQNRAHVTQLPFFASSAVLNERAEFVAKENPATQGQSFKDAQKIWKQEEQLHREITKAERACGLRNDLLKFNLEHDPELNLEQLQCLVEIRSPRAAWKAFLASIETSRSQIDPCRSVDLAALALKSSNYAIVSEYGLKRADNLNPLLPFAAHYRILSFKNAVVKYFEEYDKSAIKFVNHLEECDVISKDQVSASVKNDVMAFFRGIVSSDR